MNTAGSKREFDSVKEAATKKVLQHPWCVQPHLVIVNLISIYLKYIYKNGSIMWNILPGNEVDKLWRPSIGLTERRRRFGGDHKNGSHRVDVAIRRFTLGHL